MAGITLDGKFYPLTSNGNGALGIENLKSVVGFAGDVARKVKAFKADGKYDWWERLRSLGLVVEGVQLLPRYNDLLNEIKDLSASEYAELVAYAVAEFGLDGTRAAVLVANVVPKVVQIINLSLGVYQDVDSVF